MPKPTHCPDCGSFNTDEESRDADEDGTDTAIYYYSCSDCGCEFDVTEHVSYTVDVSKHGDQKR